MAASAAAGEISDPASETSISEMVYEELAEVFVFAGCATGLCPVGAGRGGAAGAGALETGGSGFLSKIATGACKQG